MKVETAAKIVVKVKVTHCDANKARRAKKFASNRERWTLDPVYQARQAERKVRLAPKPVIVPTQ